MTEIAFVIGLVGLQAAVAVAAVFCLAGRIERRTQTALSTMGVAFSAATVADVNVVKNEVAAALRGFNGSITGTLSAIPEMQRAGFDIVGGEVIRLRDSAVTQGSELRQELSRSLSAVADSVVKQVSDIGSVQRQHSETLAAQLTNAASGTDARLESLRATVDARLKLIQDDNNTQLERIRSAVEEKLDAALERRLAESFKTVSERLESVHRGLGEMQALASGIGDLKKVLSNVATRAYWSEAGLGHMLSRVLSTDQYAANVEVRPGSGERVEFAIKLPGASEHNPIWLPIDAKFPQSDYARLVEASERGDAVAVEAAAKELEAIVRSAARDVRAKYVHPPETTDFAVLYLPTEGLYAEVLRRPGLAESLTEEFRVVVAGPMTLAALLNSLQIGFRTLAVQKRSSEVWDLLAAVKGEFHTYATLLVKIQKKLHEASNTVDAAAVRTRVIERKLRAVQDLSAEVSPLAIAQTIDATEVADLVEANSLIESD